LDQEIQATPEHWRALVLKHPDLARRLVTDLGYAKPEQWNGFIPPYLFNGSVNDSPRRAIFVDIAAEALRRERYTVS